MAPCGRIRCRTTDLLSYFDHDAIEKQARNQTLLPARAIPREAGNPEVFEAFLLLIRTLTDDCK
jgi:hypothetical protein